MKLFYFFLMLIFFASCKSPKLDEDEYEVVRNYSIPIEQRGMRSINSSNSVLKQDLSMLGSLFSSELVLLELGDMKINSKRVVTKESGNSINFYFHTCDSIFYFKSEGNFIRKYDTSGVHVGYSLQLDEYVISFMVNSPLAISESIYFSVVSKEYNYSEEDSRKLAFSNSSPVLKYNFSGSNLSYIDAFGDYPEEFLSGKDFYNHSPNVITGLNNELIISYQSDHNLWVYNKDFENKTIVKSRSKYINTFNYLHDNEGSNIRLVKEFMQKEPKYTKIIADIHKENYYRVVKHRFDLKKGSKSDDQFKWSVIVLDDDFTVKGEVVFSYADFTPDIFIPTSRGVLLKKAPKNRTEYNNGELILSLIDFKL